MKGALDYRMKNSKNINQAETQCSKQEHCDCHQEEHEHCDCHHEEHEHCGCCHGDHEETHECGCGCGHDHGESRTSGNMILRYALGAIPVILGFLPFLPSLVRIVASVLGYLLFGAAVWKGMIRGFGKRRIFTEFTLMCAATVGAFAIGEYADAAAVMYLYSLGESISDGAYARSKKNISELIQLAPEYATVLRNGKPERVPPEAVEEGEMILITAGERFPLDGVVAEGGGSADASSVTGESKPLELYSGVFCPSGAILNDGSVTLRVSARYENSIVSKLKRAVEEASKHKSASEKKISRFAGFFTPCAFGAAALITILGGLWSGDFLAWLRVGLMILVVSCPCSLVLSVPLTYFAGIGAGATRGIVFRGGEIMDSMCRLRAVGFDKTGTLTESGLHYDGCELYGDMNSDMFLSVAYAVLCHSPHAAAIAFCKSYSGKLAYTVTDVESIGGRGIMCRVDGKQAAFGNAALMREMGIDWRDCPHTAIFGAIDGALQGKLSFSTSLKERSADAIALLRKKGIHRIAVLSGDSAEAVATACRQAGIEEYYSALTPSEKADTFEKICGEERRLHGRATVAYCGDGLNDSAVIAKADVGIAMGGCGSALTVSSADVVLMDDDPMKICEAVDLARRTSRIAGQNIAISLGIKIAVLIVGILLSATGGEGLSMELAIIADVGAAVLAVLNALRAAKRERGHENKKTK